MASIIIIAREPVVEPDDSYSFTMSGIATR